MWIIWACAGIGLLLSLVRGVVLREPSVHPSVAADAVRFTGGFTSSGVYPSTDRSLVPPHVRVVGSWLQGDQWEGESETSWVKIAGTSLCVYVAGYPQHAGCNLTAEFLDSSRNTTHLPCPLANPRESWQQWRLTVPTGSTAMRLVARDAATDNAGWFAYSEPLPTPSAWLAAAFMAAQVFTTVALAFTLVWGPGLLIASTDAPHEVRTALLLGVGPLVLVGLGLLIWVTDGVVRPHHLAFVLATTVWLAIGWQAYRRPVDVGGGVATALMISLLVVVGTAAKASYSGGPEGELYGGTISRTLAVGDRSDSRISFHVVQTVGHHLAPWHPSAEAYFSPWTFFSRGPLAGLAAVPISLATSGPPPLSMPDQAWTPFDTTGFVAYRIVLMTLGSAVVVVLFCALLPFVGAQWALIGAGLLALSPFGVHEVLFTWPKWEATAWILAAFLLAHRCRFVTAGIALGVGYLYHPLAGLWAPWLALWSAGRGGRHAWPRIKAAGLLATGFVGVAGAWMPAGKLAPHLAGSTDAGQAGFLSYFAMADYAPATWSWWWQSREMNFANTFVPLWLFLRHPDRVGSIYGPASAVVKFAFSWWNTLPFAMGLCLWAASLITLGGAIRRHLAAILTLVIGPALLLIVYWGAHATGLMRECGHPLLAGIIGVTVFVLSRANGRITRLIEHPIFPWLQLAELVPMLWLTTVLNPHARGAPYREMDPLYLVGNGCALIAAAALSSRARTGKRCPIENAARVA